MKTIAKLKQMRLTGIGSLPHHNLDTALEYSFKFGIPFLPQIPLRNPWETMLAQALEGLPGLVVDSGGMVSLALEIWESQSHLLNRRLKDFFDRGIDTGFEPSGATTSGWQPFLWELQERGIEFAKTQIAGPLTCQWALKIQNGSRTDQYPELESQIYQLILARSMTMVRSMREMQVQPIVYLDEPGLYLLSLEHPKHVLALQELKLLIQTLQKEGAIVGLHCCSNTVWEAVFKLGMDILSIDTALSLTPALKADHGNAMREYLQNGGTLSLGVIPTGRSSILQTLDSKEVAKGVLAVFQAQWPTDPGFVSNVLETAIYTPACGLAFQSTIDVEVILEKLLEVYYFFHPSRI